MSICPLQNYKLWNFGYFTSLRTLLVATNNGNTTHFVWKILLLTHCLKSATIEVVCNCWNSESHKPDSSIFAIRQWGGSPRGEFSIPFLQFYIYFLYSAIQLFKYTLINILTSIEIKQKTVLWFQWCALNEIGELESDHHGRKLRASAQCCNSHYLYCTLISMLQCC